jgi:hypothetical protein
MAIGLPLPSLPSSGRGRRAADTWSPTALGLADSATPIVRLPGESSDEDARDGSGSGLR